MTVFLLTLAYTLFAAVATALASAAHGGNHLPKGVVVALHTLFAPLVSPLFWLFFRRGHQARAELDVIAGRGGLKAVRKSYPIGIGTIVALAIARCKTRRQQELLGGFAIGLILAAATSPVTFIVVALCV